jgi:hypothetical protein
LAGFSAFAAVLRAAINSPNMKLKGAASTAP